MDMDDIITWLSSNSMIYDAMHGSLSLTSPLTMLRWDVTRMDVDGHGYGYGHWMMIPSKMVTIIHRP